MDTEQQGEQATLARQLADAAAQEHPTPLPVEIADGRFAFAAYTARSGAGDLNFRGEPTPGWDEMGDRQRAGWIAVGRAFAARHG